MVEDQIAEVISNQPEHIQILIDTLRDIDLYADVADPPLKPARFADMARKGLDSYVKAAIALKQKDKTTP